MAINTRAMSEQLIRSKVNNKTFAKFGKRLQVAEAVQKKAGKEFGLEKKAALATLLENTSSLLEATNTQNIPSKTFFLDMITAVVPNLIASDIVSVQAMDSKAGIISYLRYKYGTTKGSTTAGTVFSTSLNTGMSDPMYTSRVVDNELYSSGANLDFTPVIAGTFSATDGAGKTLIEGTATGNTVTLTCPTDPAVTGTLDYITGAVTFTGTTGDVLMTYSYDNETVPFNNITNNAYQNVIPELNMDLAQLPIYAKSRKLAAYWGFDAAYDLKKQYGAEINDVISTQAAGEIAHRQLVA